jgi:hypothetical protein
VAIIRHGLVLRGIPRTDGLERLIARARDRLISVAISSVAGSSTQVGFDDDLV